MNEGWLWLSILKTTASPPPISMTPAFSPGPQMTRGPVVGKVFSQIFDDLYEQCSLHIAEKIPSSVRFGVRPRIVSTRANSSVESPISAASAGVMFEPALFMFCRVDIRRRLFARGVFVVQNNSPVVLGDRNTLSCMLFSCDCLSLENASYIFHLIRDQLCFLILRNQKGPKCYG